MFRNSAVLLVTTVAVLTFLGMKPVHAQQAGPGRLPSGLFGGGTATAEQLLALGLSAGGGYSSTVQTAKGVVTDGSTFGHVGGNLAYSFSRPRVALWASAASSAQYYPDVANQLPVRNVGSAGVSFNVPVSSRTSVTAAQTANYQPLQIVSLFPGLVAPGLGVGPSLPVDPDLATTGDGYVTYDSSASLGHQLSRRTAVTMALGYTRSGRLSAAGDVSTGRVGGRLTRNLARGLGVRLGYEYTRGAYRNTGTGQTAHFGHHNVDAGVDFDRALSLTRRTTFSFATGSTVVSDGVRSNFHLTGHALLNHDIGQSWHASVAYRRDVGFLGTFRAPVFSDSLAIGASGFLGPRLQMHSAIGAATGEVGLSQGNGFTSYYGTTGVTVGVTQYLGVDVNYSYYRSSFDTAVFLSTGVPDDFGRQSVRASVRVWVPLIHRARRSNAAR